LRDARFAAHRVLVVFVWSGLLCAGQSATISPAASAVASPCPTGTVNSALPGQPVQCSFAPGFASWQQQSPYSDVTAPWSAREPGGGPGVATVPAFPTSVPPTRSARPISTRSEFEQFAEGVGGQPLRVYGRQLFSQAPTTFAPVSHIPVPVNYVIGPGDQLWIRIWGKIDLDTRVFVDRNGQIFLPRVGTLSVVGLRFDQLEGFLSAAVAKLYKGFELSVTMGQLRSIQIFVLGEARQPGAYTVSSLSTLVDALLASGGPGANGTMRDIQLRRDGRVVTHFDVYNLLRDGDMSHDAQLLPGDVIYIPPAGPQVAITGNVNDPGVYELKGATEVAAALKEAGGLSSVAATDRVLLDRIDSHKMRHVVQFALNASGLQRNLQDGDILKIYPISPQIQNVVTLRGNVAQPGQYAWRPGMRISDLIPSRGFLITRGYWNQQNDLVPGNINNPFGPSPSQIASPAMESSHEEGNQSTETSQSSESAGGQMNRPDSVKQSSRQGAMDQQNGLGQGGSRILRGDLSINAARNYGEINWNYAAIERLDKHDLSTRLIAFNLGKAIDDHASSDDELLEPGDVVTIFSQKDIPLPEDQHAIFVRVVGEVKAPGVYRVKPEEGLRQVVEQAGGLTRHSYLYASQLMRVSTRLAEEEQLRVSINEMQRELLSRYVAVPSFVATGGAGQQSQLAAQQAAIAQLSEFRPTGRIVLDINPHASRVADIPNLPLEDGDTFYIPARLGTVQVEGAVYNANAFRYEPGKRLEEYLHDAGGPTRGADTKRIFLIRADGTVISSQSHGLYSAFWHGSFNSLTLLPGDAIVVPSKIKSPYGIAQQLPFYTQIMSSLSQTAMMGAVIGTVY
jgi:protein involved in polysaccharide export with SLBB domain